MIIEKLAGKNIEALAQLMVELWLECELLEEGTNCHRILSSENETSFLVKKKSEYLGFIYLSIRTDYVEGATSSPVAYVEGIYVKPEFQRSGIAGKLVELGEDWGIRKGCSQLGSDTDITNNTSIRFHQKAGFKETNRIVCFLKDLK